MEKRTRIVVLHARELIYTGIFVGLGILLIILIILMFKPKGNDNAPENEPTGAYTAGVYSTSILLNGTPVDVSVTVDSDHINSIELVNLSESVTTMYPLLEPSLNDISQQILTTQSLENITYPEDSQYTYALLMEAIKASLEKAGATVE